MVSDVTTYKPPTHTRRALRLLFSEATSLLALALPLIAGSASSTLFGLIHSYFLGPLGAVPLVAVSLTGSVSIRQRS